jgi:hypothetical protein
MDTVTRSIDNQTIRFLIERLNWPVRMVRWVTAREYAGLLQSSKWSEPAKSIFLEWLSTRTFETEVTSGLAVLTFLEPKHLPSFQEVARVINRPSILADIMLQSIYGFGNIRRGWLSSHSGEVDAAYQPEEYFDKHKTAHVPGIMSGRFRDLEESNGFPLMQQWTYEWQRIMKESDAPHSGYPYHFVDSSRHRCGVNGQFSQRQCDVYRSAFLRTLACAVDQWRMPMEMAEDLARLNMPVTRGIAEIHPSQRPAWLGRNPELCCAEGADLEQIARKLVALRPDGYRPVTLKIPINVETAEYGELLVAGVLATADFVPDPDDKWYFRPSMGWTLPESDLFGGQYGTVSAEEYLSAGNTGLCVPVCLDVWPLPSGFWHNDYFVRGIQLPAPYLVAAPLSVEADKSGIHIFDTSKNNLADWLVWHDRWNPTHVGDGHTRCGMITTLKTSVIEAAEQKLDMKLGWVVQLKTWKQQAEYEEYKLGERTVFFHD